LLQLYNSIIAIYTISSALGYGETLMYKYKLESPEGSIKNRKTKAIMSRGHSTKTNKNYTHRNWRWVSFEEKNLLILGPILLLWIFNLYLASFRQHLYMDYASLSWNDVPWLYSALLHTYFTVFNILRWNTTTQCIKASYFDCICSFIFILQLYGWK
jgi:hypothetical protein